MELYTQIRETAARLAEDSIPRKSVIVTMEPVEIFVPEDWTDEQITAEVERELPGLKSWKYSDEWRN